MWAVIETIEESKHYISIVPMDWIDKKGYVSWPFHLKTQKEVDQAIECLEPKNELWVKIPIHKILSNQISKYFLYL